MLLVFFLKTFKMHQGVDLAISSDIQNVPVIPNVRIGVFLALRGEFAVQGGMVIPLIFLRVPQSSRLWNLGKASPLNIPFPLKRKMKLKEPSDPVL